MGCFVFCAWGWKVHQVAHISTTKKLQINITQKISTFYWKGIVETNSKEQKIHYYEWLSIKILTVITLECL